MSRESVFDTQPRSYPSYSFQTPLSSVSSHPQPRLQQTERLLHDAARPFLEPGIASYQAPQSQIDWIINTLRQEASKHSETRLALQSSYQAHLQAEQFLLQERASNQALRVKVQEVEMRNVYLEGKLRAYEQHSFHIEPSAPTPELDYKSSSFSPSITLTLPTMKESMPDTSGEKRQSRVPRHPATTTPPGNPDSPVITTDSESEEE